MHTHTHIDTGRISIVSEGERMRKERQGDTRGWRGMANSHDEFVTHYKM